MFEFVSIFDLREHNRGCYDSPHSGVGIEYSPLGIPLDEKQLLLHETGFLQENDWWMFPNTVSPFWRLYYNFTPGHKVVFPGHEIPLEPEHLVLIPDHLVFHSEGTGPVPHFWMTFSLGLVLREVGPLVLPIRDHELDLIHRIRDRFTGPTEADRFAVFHESHALLHQLVTRPEMSWNPQPRSAAAIKVADYVCVHFAEPLSVSALAKLAGMTPRALSAMFQREYHASPLRFVASVRVREAARLLATTTASLDEIAARTGFADRYYLTRIFTRIAGKPPARFRREHFRSPGTR